MLVRMAGPCTGLKHAENAPSGLGAGAGETMKHGRSTRQYWGVASWMVRHVARRDDDGRSLCNAVARRGYIATCYGIL